MPWVSSFRELNVRTCVTAGGKPGIWFFSLDCESPGAVEVARRTYRLPYFRARMSSQRDGDEIEYSSVRCEPGSDGVVFHARYAPDGDVFEARKGLARVVPGRALLPLRRAMRVGSCAPRSTTRRGRSSRRAGRSS